VSAFPKVALAVLEDVSAKLRDAQSRLRSSAGAVPVEARLASALLMLSARLGQPDGEGRTLGAPLSQEDLAAMTGSTLETVNRVLAQWRKGKIVTTGRRRLSIIDVPALAAISEAGQ
ncbi:MAG TPA: Crp/Fnr family transcriptional regulator, partial [Trueperaceae bacterium]|nr:Crp/Fnr family transcriptional regulator [Trueperaceae bacterium]